MCVNLTIGLATPPMGLVLFVSASLTGDKVEVIAKEMLPFLAIEIAIMFVITFSRLRSNYSKMVRFYIRRIQK